MNYNDTLGALFLGAMFNALLYGMMCLQCFHFLRNYECRGYLFKSSIWGLLFLDTLHMAFTSESVYTWTVRDFGNDALILKVPWTMAVSAVLTTCITAIVQCWYCHRMWILSEKNRLLTYPLICVIVLSAGFGLASNGKSFEMKNYQSYVSTHWLTYLNLGLSAAGDIYLTLALCYYLYQHRTPSSHREIYATINILIAYTINTGLLTSIVAIVTLITNATMPDNYIFVSTWVLQGEIYSNSLIASLTACQQLRRQPAVREPMTTLRFAQDTEATDDASAFEAGETGTGDVGEKEEL